MSAEIPSIEELVEELEHCTKLVTSTVINGSPQVFLEYSRDKAEAFLQPLYDRIKEQGDENETMSKAGLLMLRRIGDLTQMASGASYACFSDLDMERLSDE